MKGLVLSFNDWLHLNVVQAHSSGISSTGDCHFLGGSPMLYLCLFRYFRRIIYWLVTLQSKVSIICTEPCTLYTPQLPTYSAKKRDVFLLMSTPRYKQSICEGQQQRERKWDGRRESGPQGDVAKTKMGMPRVAEREGEMSEYLCTWHGVVF